MVRALLNGTKTQTRRVVKPQPWASCSIEDGMKGEPPFVFSALSGDGPGHDVNETRTPCRCPYGQPGDRLWVRETWSTHTCYDDVAPAELTTRSIHYWADGEIETGKGRPSIHMPRRFSRIDLEVTSVRVERLQDISETDALAEGIDMESDHASLCLDIAATTSYPNDLPRGSAPVAVYKALWEQINSAGTWAANPWVWVVEFKRIDQGARHG